MRNYNSNLTQDSFGQSTLTHTYTSRKNFLFEKYVFPFILMIVYLGGGLLTMNSCQQEIDVIPSEQKTLELRDGLLNSSNLLDDSSCFPASTSLFTDLIHSGSNEVIDIPGYCKIKVSYEIWFSHIEGFYQLDNVDWEPNDSSCEAWSQAVYNQCTIDCAPIPGPPIPACLEECILKAKEELEVAIRDYILDQYIKINTQILDCPFTNEAVTGRFSRAQCRSYCVTSSTDGISIFNYNEVICGVGCCLYISSYCKTANGEVVVNKSSVRSLVNCDQFSTSNACQFQYGVSYQTPCTSNDCIQR